ncbi:MULTISPECIES: bacteriocin-like protein [Chryseobacterium]
MKNLKKLSRAELKVLTGGISPYIVKCCKDRTCPTNPYCLRVLTPV